MNSPRHDWIPLDWIGAIGFLLQKKTIVDIQDMTSATTNSGPYRILLITILHQISTQDKNTTIIGFSWFGWACHAMGERMFPIPNALGSTPGSPGPDLYRDILLYIAIMSPCVAKCASSTSALGERLCHPSQQ